MEIQNDLIIVSNRNFKLQIENIPNAISKAKPKAAIAQKAAPVTKILTRAAIKKSISDGTNQMGPPVLGQPAIKSKVTTNASTVVKPKDDLSGKPSRTSRRISNDFERTEESLYMSALEDVSNEGSRLSSFFESKESATPPEEITLSSDSASSGELLKATSSTNSSITDSSFFTSSQGRENELIFATKPVPKNVIDFDKENWDDPHQVSHYAMDIFNYLRYNEYKYKIDDYIEKQPELSKWMRSLLVDWMVEVQESFELNHETLYLAVKIVDKYLSRVKVSKDLLQLLGAASLLIACKFDVSSKFYFFCIRV